MLFNAYEHLNDARVSNNLFGGSLCSSTQFMLTSLEEDASDEAADVDVSGHFASRGSLNGHNLLMGKTRVEAGKAT